VASGPEYGGIAAALAAATAFGAAAVLQGAAAARTKGARGVDPRLLLRLLRQPTFLAALVLTLGGFVLHVVALRSLTLFLVQPLISSSVAVTALLEVRFFGVRLSPADWGAVAGVCFGLGLLAAASGDAGTGTATRGFHLGLLVAVVAVAAVGTLAARLRGPAAASLLGLASGGGFGVVGVATRVLPSLLPATVLTDPAGYALLVGGCLAFLLYAVALQRGSVTTTTAAVVLGQTVAPSAVGIFVLGDAVRPGWAPVAVLGLALAAVSSTALAQLEAQPTRASRSLDRAD